MTTVIEQLPSNIPRLEPDSSNWAIFRMCFREAMEATSRGDILMDQVPALLPLILTSLLPMRRPPLLDGSMTIVARYLLSQRLPDTTTVRLSHFDTTAALWSKVVDEYQAKSVYAQDDLESTFFDMRCSKGGDVRAFLTSLRYKQEELAAAGPITSADSEELELLVLPVPKKFI
jgi:hypothetical protein